jgi:ribonuclease HII
MPRLKYELELFARGKTVVAGVDEAGRGAMAGPVVAACFLLKNNEKVSKYLLREVDDSKKLSAKKRLEIYHFVAKNYPSNYSVGIVANTEIDQTNILLASLKAMRYSIESAREKPEIVLVDGNRKIEHFSVPQKTVIKGDQKVFCIAVASIVAKVSRDTLMETYESKFPLYSFSRHKGYGTQKHKKEIEVHGLSDIHRKSFIFKSSQINSNVV